MKISYIIAEKEKRGIGIYSIPSDATLKEVAGMLNKYNVGALLVTDSVDKDKHVGIISERDVIRHCCDDLPLDQLKVSDIKLSDMIVITGEDTIETARGIMSRHHIRHLPVIMDHKICGMITIRDVNKVLDQQKDIHIQHLSDFFGGTYGNTVY